MSHHRTVYVIDRDLATRRSLAAHLASTGAEAWPFASGAELLEILDHLMPACVLLDLDLTYPSGMEVLEKIVARKPGWPIVALSARDEVALAVEAMKLGALDFLAKPIGATALAAALVPAWRALEASVEESEARRSAQERVGRLTAREVDISIALLRGRPNKAVAYEFGISVRTVEMHRAHILAKLGVRNLAEAAVLATQAGLVPGDGTTRAAPMPAPSARIAAAGLGSRSPARPAARRLTSRSAF
jgi:two-component system response regulator FixJ